MGGQRLLNVAALYDVLCQHRAKRWHAAIPTDGGQGRQRRLRIRQADDQAVVIDAEKHNPALAVSKSDDLAGNTPWMVPLTLKLRVWLCTNSIFRSFL